MKSSEYQRDLSLRKQIFHSLFFLSLVPITSSAATTNLTFSFDSTGSNINLTDTFIEETIVIPTGAEAGTYVLRATHSLATSTNPVALFNNTGGGVFTSATPLPVASDLLLFWQGGGAPVPAGAAEQWQISLTRNGNPFDFSFTSADVFIFGANPSTFLFENELGQSIVTHTTDPAAASETITPTNVANATDISNFTITTTTPGLNDTVFNDFNDITVQIEVVPEPSTTTVLLGSLAIGLFRRKRS